MVTHKDISECAQQIARRFHPERIILFGSYAYGNPTEDSDIDLLVVLPHEESAAQQAAMIRLHVDVTFPMDVIVHSPESIKERERLNDFVIKEILAKGRVLYAADHC